LPPHLLNPGDISCVTNAANDVPGELSDDFQEHPDDSAQNNEENGATSGVHSDPGSLTASPATNLGAAFETDSPDVVGADLATDSPASGPDGPTQESAPMPPRVTRGGDQTVTGARTTAAPPTTTDQSSSDQVVSVSPVSPRRTRSQHGIVKPKKFTDGTVRWMNFCSTGAPKDLQEALTDPKWQKAMQRRVLSTNEEQNMALS